MSKIKPVILILLVNVLCFCSGCSIGSNFYRGMADADFEAGKYDSAIAKYNKAIEIDPNFSSVRSRLGLAYTYLGQHAKAIKYYNEALDIFLSRKGIKIVPSLNSAYSVADKSQLINDMRLAHEFYKRQNMAKEAEETANILNRLKESS